MTSSTKTSPQIFSVLLLTSLLTATAARAANLNFEDDPSKGDPEAALVMAEFSSFQCGYCFLFHRAIQPEIERLYVDTGKLELVFLDLPLREQANSSKAAEAAQCAGEQDKFWEMQEVLFANQADLWRDNLPGYAEEAGVERGAFEECMRKGKHSSGIKADVRAAENLEIFGTPNFALGWRKPGTRKMKVVEVIRGAIELEELQAKIDALLASR